MMQLPATLRIPDEALKIARTLAEAGHEVWCIGGVVRDSLLGLPHDGAVDLATSALPDEVQRLFRRTVPIGVEHGTVAVLDRHNTAHEITTFRKDVTTDGRHAQVAFGVSLEDDLARRDFTINAIAYQPLTHEWKDPFGGAGDLEAKRLRAVGDPAARFREDYLRILRLLRFAARFGFAIDPATWEAARGGVAGLGQLSAERVRAEWFRGLVSARSPARLLELWDEVGALPMWLPELMSGAWYAVSGSAAGSAGGPLTTHHSPMTRIDALPRDPVLVTSYLSADPVATLTRLKCANAEIERGRRIAEHRGAEPDPAAAVAVRKWLARAGPAADDLLHVARAEGRGAALSAAVNAVRDSGAPLTLGDLAITGQDLMELGVPQGPRVGDMLRRLLDEALEDPAVNTKPRLIQRARELQRDSGGWKRRDSGETRHPSRDA
jgi:tRNA nucleotidyltransferase (CCA-adding enzyme)